MKEGWMKNDEGWMKENTKDEELMMEDDDFKLLRVLMTDRQTDICECRVAFATEN